MVSAAFERVSHRAIWIMNELKAVYPNGLAFKEILAKADTNALALRQCLHRLWEAHGVQRHPHSPQTPAVYQIVPEAVEDPARYLAMRRLSWKKELSKGREIKAAAFRHGYRTYTDLAEAVIQKRQEIGPARHLDLDAYQICGKLSELDRTSADLSWWVFGAGKYRYGLTDALIALMPELKDFFTTTARIQALSGREKTLMRRRNALDRELETVRKELAGLKGRVAINARRSGIPES